MLGTDYPFPLGELQPGTLIESMEEFDDTLKALTVSLSFQQIQLYWHQHSFIVVYSNAANYDKCLRLKETISCVTVQL